MAEVVLQHLRKIYPLAEEKRRKKGKNEKAPSRSNLQITPEGLVAVQDFNLTVADKEFVVLVGPSGCGKSTTLRMVAGLESITSGDLFIDGERVNDALPRERDIAMVLQNYALYPHMTVYENMAFALKLRHMSKAEIDQRVRQAAEILDLSDLLKRKPKALSGGQRQRVAIGRAIVREPKVFLLDEPRSSLDAKLRNQRRTELTRLRSRVDTTFLYVTHDQVEAMTLGDRIVVMRDGYVQQIGTPRQVFEHPANRFVAGFIGTPPMNFFPAILARQGDRYGVVLGRTLIPLNGEKNRALAAIGREQGPVLLGLRPEKLLLCDSEANGAIPARVEVAELLGSQVQLHGRLDRDEVVLSLSTLDLNASPKALFPPGAAFAFTFAGEDCHLFDPETEKNLMPEG